MTASFARELANLLRNEMNFYAEGDLHAAFEDAADALEDLADEMEQD